MKEIKFKTLGYVAIEVNEKQTKGGKVRQIVNALSTKIYKRKGDAMKLQNKLKAEKQNRIAGVAGVIDILRNKVIRLKKAISEKSIFTGLISKSVAYFRLHCAKIKLFGFIKGLSKGIQRKVNQLMINCQTGYNFNLKNLNIA